MDFTDLVIPVMVFVIFVGGAFTAYQVADGAQNQAAQVNATVTNETLTQQVGNWQLVSKSTEEFTAGFNDTVTVYNQSGVELTEGTDYEWNSTDGAIKYLDTANTQDGNSSNITYTYFENTEAVKDLSGPVGVITTAVGKSAYLVGGLGLVVLLLAVVGLVAKVFGESGPQTNR